MLVGVGGSGYAVYSSREIETAPTLVTAPVTRGAIVDAISSTGTLQAVTSVQVGTQVSGTIESLGADFNSIVKRGQVLARLDQSLFQTQVEQNRANLVRAEADVERLRVGLEDAHTKLARAETLSRQQLLPQSELDAAAVAVRSAEAQVRSAEAQVAQARAVLRQTEVNLENTVITAPIDGIVLSRSVDVGQTVAASMQAPTLFVLAADLTRMQVLANLDESDIGRIARGQSVTFTVDAHPGRTFEGVVAQVRLQPQTVQNVVTYSVLIDAPNRDLGLKPGMTANVTIEVARRDDALRVPSAALRFRPSGQTSSLPQVWRSESGELTPVPVTTGLSDGQFTEIVKGSLSVGQTVAIRQSTPEQSVRPAATASPFQFMQPQMRPR
jgi:HlyD family secretion protein